MFHTSEVTLFQLTSYKAIPQRHLAQVSLPAGRSQVNSAIKGICGLGWRWSLGGGDARLGFPTSAKTGGGR